MAAQSSRSTVFDSYTIRAQVGLALSLALTVVLVKLPLDPLTPQVGWSPESSTRPPEHIVLSEIQSESSTEETSSEPNDGAPPPVDMQASPSQQVEVNENLSAAESQSEQTGSDTSEDSSAFDRGLETVSPLSLERKPKIAGGLGSLYLNIQYPERARRAGIQGRLKLEFTVLRDGQVRGVDVVDSLHPLCDSAAVEGVRSVRFIPAERNGSPIPIRVRLPIRFRLISSSDTPQTAELNP